jgi:hypothetical protein
MDKYRAHAEVLFSRDGIGIHLAIAEYVAQPTEIMFDSADEGIVTEPALTMPHGLALALYHALGVGLGLHTPDAKFAAEVLAKEQDRVDRLIGATISVMDGHVRQLEQANEMLLAFWTAKGVVA